MSQIIITKGKLLKGDKVEIDYKQKATSDGKAANCSYEHDAAPRNQMKKAFANLSVHAALLSEFISITSIPELKKLDPELIKDFNVSGFSMVADGTDDEGVIITAQKTLKSGKSLGFNTPIIRFGDTAEDAYPYLDELEEAVGFCKDELREYLNGNYAPDPQQSLFAKDGKDETSAEVSHEQTIGNKPKAKKK